MCTEFALAVELNELVKEMTISCECYVCDRCMTCSKRVPVLSYGNGLAEDFAEKVNAFVLSDKERIRG